MVTGDMVTVSRGYFLGLQGIVVARLPALSAGMVRGVWNGRENEILIFDDEIDSDPEWVERW